MSSRDELGHEPLHDAEYGYMSQCSEYFDLATFQFDRKILKIGERFQGIQDSSVSPFPVFISGYPSVDVIMHHELKSVRFIKDAPDCSYSCQ